MVRRRPTGLARGAMVASLRPRREAPTLSRWRGRWLLRFPPARCRRLHLPPWPFRSRLTVGRRPSGLACRAMAVFRRSRRRVPPLSRWGKRGRGLALRSSAPPSVLGPLPCREMLAAGRGEPMPGGGPQPSPRACLWGCGRWMRLSAADCPAGRCTSWPACRERRGRLSPSPWGLPRGPRRGCGGLFCWPARRWRSGRRDASTARGWRRWACRPRRCCWCACASRRMCCS